MATVKEAIIAILCLVCEPSLVISGQESSSRDSADNGGVDYQVPKGGSQALNCSQPGAPSLDIWLNVTWVLPDLTLIQRDANLVYKSRTTTFYLSQDGQVLYLDNVHPDWYGDYYCMLLYDPRQFYVTKFGINTSFAYSDVLWKEYRHVVVIIGVACGTVLAVFTLVFCLVTWCRRSTRRQGQNSQHNSPSPGDHEDQSVQTVANKGPMWATHQHVDLSWGHGYPTSSKPI